MGDWNQECMIEELVAENESLRAELARMATLFDVVLRWGLRPHGQGNPAKQAVLDAKPMITKWLPKQEVSDGE